MDTYIPLISSRLTGPLGLAHLPRVWLKLRLHAQGKLPQGYRAGQGGADATLLTALGLDAETTISFIRDTQPAYLAFEAWVRENATPQGLTPDAIARTNDRILLFVKPEPERSRVLDTLGLPNDDTEWTAPELNELEDWHGFHLALLDEAEDTESRKA